MRDRQSQSCAELKPHSPKSHKTDNIIVQKEGLDTKNIIKEIPIGSRIAISIVDDKGKVKLYKATVMKKIRNKYQVKYDNGDPIEVLNLDKEKFKILK